jgi:pseudouridine kinase
VMADVVVIGGANVDIKAIAGAGYQLGTSNPGTVRTTSGGVGRNIAHNLARLGVDVALISAIGLDAHGDKLLRETGMVEVDVSLVLRENAPTGTYVAMLDDKGELVSAVSDMRVLEALTPAVIRSHARTIGDAKLVVADCNLLTETLVAVAEIAGEKLAVEPVSVQKSRKLLSVLEKHKVLVATPNLDQIRSLLGSDDPDTAASLLHQRGLQNVVIHAGDTGAFVSSGSGVQHVKLDRLTEVVDVTGAGDAAMSGLVYGLLQGDGLVAAATLGQELAAQVIASTKSTLE